MQRDIKKSIANVTESIAGLIGWCFVGAVAFVILAGVIDGIVSGLTLKSLTLKIYPFFEYYKSTFPDSLAWDPLIWFFIAVLGASTGFFFGIWRLLRRSK